MLENSAGESAPAPFAFGQHDIEDYQYPNIYDEANEMLQLSMMIYNLIDIRSLAKDPNRKDTLKSAETVLELPMSLPTCMRVLDENYDVMKEHFGEAEHINIKNAMSMIHARFEKHREWTLPSILSPINRLASFFQTDQQEKNSPMIHVVGGEESWGSVYAIGINPIRKRITVAFRGSVTTLDFVIDLNTDMQRQSNPVFAIDSNQSDQSKQIGIHYGFYHYLFAPRRSGRTKYEEILSHVKALSRKYRNYKLYVTGHSLGGALATLFSLHVASFAVSPDSIIPSPVSCVSVASPRVGDRYFQSAFVKLEELGHLRHLRVANNEDRITNMPKVTTNYVLSIFSPLHYFFFEFEKTQCFYHTGIKLGLKKGEWELITSEEDHSRNSARTWRGRSISQHSVNTYVENLSSVKNDLERLTLNDVYKKKAEAFMAENME